VAQGRDMGAAVTDAMASQAPDRPAGIHPELPAQAPVGAENLCHQAIFMNHASSAVTPPDAEVV
jgi:hypothetical protein